MSKLPKNKTYTTENPTTNNYRFDLLKQATSFLLFRGARSTYVECSSNLYLVLENYSEKRSIWKTSQSQKWSTKLDSRVSTPENGQDKKEHV